MYGRHHICSGNYEHREGKYHRAVKELQDLSVFEMARQLKAKIAYYCQKQGEGR